MKALFFAQCRLVTGRDDYLLKSERPLTQREFWSYLIEAFPGLAVHQKTSRLARHEVYLCGDELLHPTDEIAIIPPVSGG